MLNFTEIEETELYSIIKYIFPNLIARDINLLFEYYKKLMLIICITFFKKNKENLFKQIRFNDYQDGKAIFLLLLPFIKDDANLRYELKNLNDLYVAKTEDIDINKSEPTYKFCNIQYNRCRRNNGIAEEVSFNVSHIEQNYKLLIQTIIECHNKMYVNWINVFPENKKLKDVQDILTNIKLINNLDDISKIENSLDSPCYIWDIYDILTNEYYYNIKKTKWVLYNFVERKDRIVSYIPYIIIFNQLFDEKLHTKMKEWILLDKDEQSIFTKSWENIKTIFLNNDNEQFRELITVFITFLYNTFTKEKRSISMSNVNKPLLDKFNIFSEKFIQEEEQKTMIEDDDIMYYKKYFNKKEFDFLIKQILISLDVQDVYDYLRYVLKNIQYSAYNKYLLDDNNIINIEKHENLLSFNYSKQFTVKFIYNFAKALCHKTYENKYYELNRKWITLGYNDKQLILDRLQGKDKKWFNISANLKKIGRNAEENIQIEKIIKEHLYDFIIDILIQHGKLSYFEVIPELYEEKYESSENYVNFIQTTILDYVKKNNLDKDTYYYLNREQYSSPVYAIYNEETKELIKDKDFFEISFNKTKISDIWFTQYALNWVSQINFFHRYLNNSVIYVTGATGVGKSTQVPKLLLYSQIVFDNKYFTSIACTEPRQNATQNNAIRIANELACPIGHNSFIQYKYRNKYVTSYDKTPMLVIQTDGMLISDMYNNLLFTKSYKQDDNTIYIDESIYDIVIVDEAHEHNANMDIILTMMRYIMQINNRVKLVIISATMDIDEPIYRRYYRCINDNLKYPLSMTNKDLKLDRINVDRRINIVAPGKSTKHVINDIYLKDIKDIKKNPDDEDIARLVNNILKNSFEGDILIFKPGKGEIKSLVQLLNMNIPKDVLAVPYYSELEQKEFIGRLDKQKHLLKISKQENFDNDRIDFTKGNSKYNRVIIVATNIAEASITLSSLRYVIDTGTQRVATYDFYRNCESIRMTYISEQSRIQRRGRVGRVASGTVYYLYNIEDIKQVKQNYNIASQPIQDKMYSLLTIDPDNLFFTRKTDFMHGIIDFTTLTFSKENKNYKTLKSIKDFLIKNYIISSSSEDDKFITKQFDYFGDEKQYDFYNDYLFDYNYDGFTKETILDDSGQFYIIHPNETYIRRNILGQIVEHRLDTLKTQILFSSLETNMLIINNRKTLLGKIKEYISNYFSSLKEDNNSYKLLDLLLYSIIFKCQQEMLKIISILLCISERFYSKSVIREQKIGEKSQSIIPALKNQGSYKSDLMYIYNAVNLLHKYLDLDYNKYDDIILKKIYEIEKSNARDIYDMKKNKKENYTEEFLKIIIDKYDNLIKKLCNKYYLEYDFMIKYLKKYISLQTDIFCINNNDKYEKVKLEYKIEDIINILKTFKLDTININNDLQDKITSCLVLSYNSNLIYNITGTRYYINMKPESILKPIKIGTIRKYLEDRDTILLDNKLSSYLLYFKISSQEGEDIPNISLLHKIDKKFLVYLSHLSAFYITGMSKFLSEYEKIIIEDKLDNDMFKKYRSKIKDTIQELNRDSKKFFNLNISNSIKIAL